MLLGAAVLPSTVLSVLNQQSAALMLNCTQGTSYNCCSGDRNFPAVFDILCKFWQENAWKAILSSVQQLGAKIQTAWLDRVDWGCCLTLNH
jgi:hypothetical protein